MSAQKQVLLLVGSPRGPKSTSESLGTYLLGKLHEKGMETEQIHIHSSLKSGEGLENLLQATDSADILILAFPLYVDSIPAPLIKAMELIADHRKTAEKPGKKQQLLAIANSGFPEAHQNHTALAICRRFAAETAFEWTGGLALGGGPAIDGRPLKDLGGRFRRVTRSLDLTADDIAEGKPVSQEAVDLMAKPLIPPWAYTLFGGIMWKRQAKKYNAHKKLRDRPYQK